MNSSRTWKSGERCRISGTYRCCNCHLGGRDTVRAFEAGRVLPMCDQCSDRDVTWRLLQTAPRAAGSRSGYSAQPNTRTGS
jgi:hypothetical protein